MINCIVLGASGYSGAELLAILHKNSCFSVLAAFGSEQREAVLWSTTAPQLYHRAVSESATDVDLLIEPWSEEALSRLEAEHQLHAAFLALPHEISAQVAVLLVKRGIKVFDLSGAFRFQDAEQFEQIYGFKHPSPNSLQHTPYMLMPFDPVTHEAQGIYAIPGCYPTASLLALKPLALNGLMHADHDPVITAISGVSGAGRGGNLRTSFCEVSLQAYGVLNHRHQPEISNQLGRPVVFTPVLGPFPRGILAICSIKLNQQISTSALQALYEKHYQQHALVKLAQQPPAIAHVVNTPFCFIHVAVQGTQAIITAAIDNLIMGAAGQAMQAANVVFGAPQYAGLLQDGE